MLYFIFSLYFYYCISVLVFISSYVRNFLLLYFYLPAFHIYFPFSIILSFCQFVFLYIVLVFISFYARILMSFFNFSVFLFFCQFVWPYFCSCNYFFLCNKNSLLDLYLPALSIFLFSIFLSFDCLSTFFLSFSVSALICTCVCLF